MIPRYPAQLLHSVDFGADTVIYHLMGHTLEIVNTFRADDDDK